MTKTFFGSVYMESYNKLNLLNILFIMKELLPTSRTMLIGLQLYLILSHFNSLVQDHITV